MENQTKESYRKKKAKETRVDLLELATHEQPMDVDSESNEPTNTSSSKGHPSDKKRRRVNWVNVNKKKDGKLLFLSKTNLPDLFLLCQLAVSTPWEAEYGEKTKAWADVVTALSQNKDDDGKPVFVDGLTAKHVTDCFKLLMDYAKQALGNVEKRTGCDESSY